MASTQPDAATPAKQDAGDAPVSASEKSKSKSKGKITLKTPKVIGLKAMLLDYKTI